MNRSTNFNADCRFCISYIVLAIVLILISAGAGGLLDKAFGLSPVYGTIFGILLVEGFVVTTLDTAVRLNRYLFEELWQVIFKNVPKIMKSYLFNALLCVVLMYILAYNNAFLVIWPIFGSANQLLASLALIAISVWLVNKKKTAWFTILPAIFMMVTTIYSLVILLIVLSIGVIVLAYKKWRELKKGA